MSESPVPKELLIEGSSTAAANALNHLRAARALYARAPFKPLACSILALAYEEFGKALFWRAVTDGGANFDDQTLPYQGRKRRRVTESHEAKQEVAWGIVLHQMLLAAMADYYERILGRSLTIDEHRSLEESLVEGRDPAWLPTSYDSDEARKLFESRAGALANMKGDFEALQKCKERGFYVDIDRGVGKVLGPWSNLSIKFEWLSGNLELLMRQYGPSIRDGFKSR